MLEFLALLLPVAAASGWYAAFKHYKGKQYANAVNPINRAYYRGLNYLINEKPDKAIDVFVDILEADSETVETHMALGNLFRRRGEVERAIRIHQSLINKPTLNKEQRSQALYELGMDYMRAGMYGRAESLFIELVDDGIFKDSALQQLLQIAQHEKEWKKAIEITRKLEKLKKIKTGETVAQFCCELAEQAKVRGQTKKALAFLDQAFAEDKECVRASLLKASIEIDTDQYRCAVKTLKQVEKQDAGYLSEILPLILDCYQHLSEQDEEIRYLHYLYEVYDLDEVIVVLAKLIKDREGIAKSLEFMLEATQRNPSLKSLNGLIALQLETAGNGCRETLQGLQQISSRLLTRKASYRCSQCGFSGENLHWRCPTCSHWGSIKPEP